MDSILVAANVVIPMMLMIGLGIVLRITKVIDPPDMKKLDRIIFKVLLPFMAFCNIYNSDFSDLSEGGLILYCVGGLLFIFVGCLIIIPKCIHEPPTAAAFGQALLRANYLVFGVAVAKSLYGEEVLGIVMLVGMAAIPVYNICITIVMERWQEHHSSPLHIMVAVLKNPMIISTFLGAVVKFSGVQIPAVVMGVLEDVGSMTTPFCFISMGVGLSFAVGPKLKLAAITAMIRLILVPIIIVGGGILLGFRGVALCTLMILFASPTAVASYPTAVAMGADAEYAAQAVAVSLISCMGTIFIWIYALNELHLL